MDRPPRLDRIAPHLPEPLARLAALHGARLPKPGQAESLLERWLENHGLPRDQFLFLHLLYIAGTSQGLFNFLFRNPELLRPLSQEARSAGARGAQELEEGLARFLLLRRREPLDNNLAAFRAFTTARILLQEVVGALAFEDAVQELSVLADTLISRAFAHTFQPLREAMGLPMGLTGDGRAVPCALAVFALGKLGGRELNYASDVDIVPFYEKEGQTDRGVDNARFFCEWVRQATALLTKPTPEGPCLKVDPNLRPRGRDGELALPFETAIAYYREWADLWERQAWVKARHCAGDPEAGRRFLRLMEEEVYRPYAFAGIVSQNRKTRQKTLAHLRRKGGQEAGRNVKEGPGGIREIEFAVQALQMALGQKDRWLREAGTLLAISKLSQKGAISEGEQAAWSRAYSLLRRAEHWAQVQEMRQTHDLPATEEGWGELGRFLKGFDAAGARAELDAARETASKALQGVLGRLAREGREVDAAGRLMSPEGIRDSLEQARFPDAERGIPILAGIYQALEPHLAQPRRRKNFLRIHYSLQRELEASPDPYASLLALHRLLPSLQSEPDLLPSLLDRPRLPRLLMRLAGRYEPFLEMLQQWPFLLGSLTYERLGPKADILAPIRRAEGPEALKRAHKEALFTQGARNVLLGGDAGRVHASLTAIAEEVLRKVFSETSTSIEKEAGLPEGVFGREIVVLGLGRLGLGEMLPRSDLDLVVVKRGEWLIPGEADRSAAAENAFVKRFAAALTGVTRYGSLYPVDFQLRPFGASGPPVAAGEGLAPYFGGPAEAWERMAYLKARPVAGNLPMGQEAAEGVWAASLAKGLGTDDVDRLLELRGRLEARSETVEGLVKFSPGGLLHMDLLLYGLQLELGLRPAPGGTLKLMVMLEEAGGLDASAHSKLFRARAFLEGMLLSLRRLYLHAPAKRRLGEVLSALERRWPEGRKLPGAPLAAADSARGCPLASAWEEHKRAVSEAWSSLLERRGGGKTEVRRA